MKSVLALLFSLSALSISSANAALKVATLHPLIADLVRQVGGEHVEVVEIMKPGGDIHHFEPTARDIAEMRGSKIIFASGKGLESYLDKLRDSLGTGVQLFEVGRNIPSIQLDSSQEIFVCCEHHAHGHIDPHWWHSTDNMRRAARDIAEVLAEADPANEDAYEDNADAARDRIKDLDRWAKKEISKISRSDRKLVTAHAAFGYFCKEFGFKSLPVLGLARGDDSSPQHLAQTIQFIRDNKIRAVFPEDQANPKVLAEIVRSTGVQLGQPLIADGTSKDAHTFETMLAHNVRAIVAALASE